MIVELSLTSLFYCENCRSRPDRKLTNSYDPETDGNRDAFHRQGVNPVVVSSAMELGTLDMGSQPESQYHLNNKGTSRKREGDVPQRFFTTVFKGT